MSAKLSNEDLQAIINEAFAKADVTDAVDAAQEAADAGQVTAQDLQAIINEAFAKACAAQDTADAANQAAQDAADAAQDAADAAQEAADAGQVTAQELQVKLDETTDQLARTRADLYNLQQEYNAYVRRSREQAASHREAGAQQVTEALIPVLDEIELARQHGDLVGSFEAVGSKIENILKDKFSLTRFGQAGDVFDPNLHEALMAVESTEVTEPTVNLVIQPGYMLGERVVRHARVQVANPA